MLILARVEEKEKGMFSKTHTSEGFFPTNGEDVSLYGAFEFGARSTSKQ